MFQAALLCALIRTKTKKNEDKSMEKGSFQGIFEASDPNRLWSSHELIHNILWMPEFLVFIGKIGKKSIDNRPPFSYNPKCTAKSSVSLNNTDRQAIWQSPATHGEVLKWLKRRPC